jgi:hypothetical protein
MTIGYVKQVKIEQARQGQLKPDAEINHAPKLTIVERATLDIFIQDNNSGVTLTMSLSREPRGQVRLVTMEDKRNANLSREPRGQVGSTQDATGCLIYY